MSSCSVNSCLNNSTSNVFIFACSGGGSNVGQISNQAAVDLAKKGKGKMFCLAGIGAKIDPIINTTKDNKKVVVIDGCPVACAKKILEGQGIDIDSYMVATEIGIEKIGGKLDFSLEEINTVVSAIEEKISNF